jgi:hypothetical protein
MKGREKEEKMGNVLQRKHKNESVLCILERESSLISLFPQQEAKSR